MPANKLIMLAVLGFILICSPTPVDAQKSMHVVFINPDPIGSPFWSHVTSFMQAVAVDLDIQLDVLYGDRSRFSTNNNFTKVLNLAKHPDYVVMIAQGEMIHSQLSAAE